MLESRKLKNAMSEKIESSSFILLMFKRTARKSWVMAGAGAGVEPPVAGTEGLEDETSPASSESPLMKKT